MSTIIGMLNDHKSRNNFLSLEGQGASSPNFFSRTTLSAMSALIEHTK